MVPIVKLHREIHQAVGQRRKVANGPYEDNENVGVVDPDRAAIALSGEYRSDPSVRQAAAAATTVDLWHSCPNQRRQQTPSCNITAVRVSAIITSFGVTVLAKAMAGVQLVVYPLAVYLNRPLQRRSRILRLLWFDAILLYYITTNPAVVTGSAR